MPIKSAEENLLDHDLLAKFISEDLDTLFLIDTIEITDFLFPQNVFYYSTYKSQYDSFQFLIGSNASRYDSIWRVNPIESSISNHLTCIYPLSENLKLQQYADGAIWNRLYSIPLTIKFNNGKNFIYAESGGKHGDKMKLMVLTKSGNYRQHFWLNLRRTLVGWNNLKEKWFAVSSKVHGKATRKRIIGEHNINESVYKSYFNLILKSEFGDISFSNYSKYILIDRLEFSSSKLPGLYAIKFNKYHPYCYYIKHVE